jgi:O-antigen biosynthesis protein WbqV
MGQPVKIVDLAERMIKLSGLQPGHDIDIVFTGMRPGERLNEILFAFEEETVEIGIAGIVAARPRESSLDAMRAWLTTLHKAVDDERRSLIEVVLKDAIPEFATGTDLASQPVTARIEQAQP